MATKAKVKAQFESEAQLCETFIKRLPNGWTAYPETAGFDILLVRNIDGAQIGVEAKMRLNPEVIVQALEQRSPHAQKMAGPDFRAVLVPLGCLTSALIGLSSRLGITVIQMHSKETYLEKKRVFGGKDKFTPDLPAPGDNGWREIWFDCCPWERCVLPEYIPDVKAGASGPLKLSHWKIKAIKIHIILDRRGYVTRNDFKEIGIDHRRFLDMGWLKRADARGKFILGKYPLNLRDQHPRVYPEIEADFDNWKTAELLVPEEVLL